MGVTKGDTRSLDYSFRDSALSFDHLDEGSGILQIEVYEKKGRL